MPRCARGPRRGARRGRWQRSRRPRGGRGRHDPGESVRPACASPALRTIARSMRRRLVERHQLPCQPGHERVHAGALCGPRAGRGRAPRGRPAARRARPAPGRARCRRRTASRKRRRSSARGVVRRRRARSAARRRVRCATQRVRGAGGGREDELGAILAQAQRAVAHASERHAQVVRGRAAAARSAVVTGASSAADGGASANPGATSSSVAMRREPLAQTLLLVARQAERGRHVEPRRRGVARPPAAARHRGGDAGRGRRACGGPRPSTDLVPGRGRPSRRDARRDGRDSSRGSRHLERRDGSQVGRAGLRGGRRAGRRRASGTSSARSSTRRGSPAGKDDVEHQVVAVTDHVRRPRSRAGRGGGRSWRRSRREPLGGAEDEGGVDGQRPASTELAVGDGLGRASGSARSISLTAGARSTLTGRPRRRPPRARRSRRARPPRPCRRARAHPPTDCPATARTRSTTT